MPTITKLKSKSRYQRHGKDLFIHKLYNTTRWRNLRKSHLMLHPLCEECLAKGIVSPAVDVHHIKEISKGESELEMQELAFDASNLMSLCKECHSKKHN